MPGSSTEQVQHARSRYQTLFELSPDAIFVVKPGPILSEWVVADCNPRAGQLLGYSREALVGLAIENLTATPLTEENVVWFRETLAEEGATASLEMTLRDIGGERIPVEVSAVTIVEQGQVQFLAVVRDLRSRELVQTLTEDYNRLVFTLNQVAMDITSTLDVEEVMLRLVNATQRLFPQVMAATVQLIDHAQGSMYTVYASAGAVPSTRKVEFRPGVGIAGLALQSGEVINVGNVLEDPRFIPGENPPPFASLLVAPLVTSSQAWGTLSLEGRLPDAFGEREEVMANVLARQAGVALENAYLFETVQRQRELADTLREIGLVLTSSRNVDEVLQLVLDQVARVLPFSTASLWIRQPDGRFRRMFGAGYEHYGMRESENRLFWMGDQEPALLQVVREQRVMIISDTGTEPTWVADPAYPWIRSWAAGPITVRGETIGAFCLDHEQPGFYVDQHLPVLEALAAQVSIAVETATLLERIQNYAGMLEEEVAARTAEIVAQKEQTEAILRTIDDAIITFDSGGRISFANQAVERLLGWTNEMLQGKSVVVFFHERSSRAMSRQMLRAIRERRTWRGEVLLKHLQGYPVLVDAIGMPYYEAGGKKVAFVASLRPLSDERVTERMKARFMTLISHELRTPLTNMNLHLHLLRKTVDNADSRRKYIEALEQQVARLTDMTDKVLDVIRLADSNALQYHAPLNLYTLFDSIDVRFRDLANSRNITFTVHRPDQPQDLPSVLGDEHWVAQACYELVENALLYTAPQGQVDVSPCLLERDGRRYLGIQVADNGPGIDPEHLKQINAFSRIGQERTGTVPGIGLGLFIAKSVAEQLGGELHVESKPGTGSTFTLYLVVKD
ncbi:MAG: hypothetical protein Kow0077_31550 [Anaerolineae bacterium]